MTILWYPCIIGLRLFYVLSTLYCFVIVRITVLNCFYFYFYFGRIKEYDCESNILQGTVYVLGHFRIFGFKFWRLHYCLFMFGQQGRNFAFISICYNFLDYTAILVQLGYYLYELPFYGNKHLNIFTVSSSFYNLYVTSVFMFKASPFLVCKYF